jgi:Ca2+-binding RTX toxin-like protein
VTITAVDAKLAVKQTFFRKVPVELEGGGIGYRYEETGSETIVYDPRELQIGREGASARFVNGVLRVLGSLADDRIRLWHSVRMPDKLVVEYNGNYRSFPFADVWKIIIDLQDGNDRVEFLEEEGGALRMRTSIFGGDGTDTIFSGTGRDTIFGGNGGDYIRGRGNDDMIIGGGGRDRIDAGHGNDVIGGGTGNDSIVGGEGNDVLFGQAAIERAFGTVWESLEDVEGDVVMLPP